MDEEQRHIPTSTTSSGSPSDPAHESPVTGESASPPFGRRVTSYVKTLLFTVLVAFLLKTFVVEAFRIPSGSMENTLLVGDFLLVNKTAYGLKTPRYIPLTNLAISSFTLPAFGTVRRGDVVVFEYPGRHSDAEGNDPTYYIKRCVGIPGDTVVIRSGQVIVDGRDVLPPSHAKSSYAGRARWGDAGPNDDSGPVDGNNFGPTIVPKKGDVIKITPATAMQWKVFVEREHHRLEIGPNGKILVDGIETSSYTVRRNYYFMLGDNRGNSLDSRFWGFVPEDNIVGEALVVYWSWDPEEAVGGVQERVSKIRWPRVGTLIR
ncbi:MAG: Signal peptidase [Bacteroidetes bacterium]|nr:Signal peptidase [Bacteroidota bacterium]